MRVIDSDISFYDVLRESDYGYVLCDAVNAEKIVIAQREHFESFSEMPAPEVLEELMAAVVALQMGTRSWVLKGHRPKDVIKEEVPMVTARAVKRPSAEVFKKHIREARVEKVKIGRNDPCSCGSGKKPKKCCGK